MSSKTLLIITGPTASGKSKLAISIAQKTGAEIINADSRQFYRGLDIGTAKVSPEERRTVPHHFIDILNPDDEYNTSLYEKQVMETLSDLFSKNDTAILCGGSGMYIRAVCEGIDEMPPADSGYRKWLEEILESQGIEKLQSMLADADPDHFETVDRMNPRRLIRALEVIHQSGLPYSSQRRNAPRKRDFRIKKAAILVDRDELYEAIERRVDMMINNGLVEEVRRLLSFRQCNSLQTVGYREIFAFLDGEISLDRAIELIKQNTRNYAKRQMTWLRKEGVRWFGPGEIDNIIAWSRED